MELTVNIKRFAALVMTVVMVFALCSCFSRYSKDPKKNAQVIVASVEKEYPENNEKPGRYCLMLHARMFNSSDFRDLDTEVKMETAEEVAELVMEKFPDVFEDYGWRKVPYGDDYDYELLMFYEGGEYYVPVYSVVNYDDDEWNVYESADIIYLEDNVEHIEYEEK